MITSAMLEMRNEYMMEISNLTGVPVDEIMGRKRCLNVSTARQLTMWALVTLCGYTDTEVGILMRRNHTTVSYAVTHVNGGYMGKLVEKYRVKLIEYSQLKKLNNERNAN